jgi:hypothetical protein
MQPAIDELIANGTLQYSYLLATIANNAAVVRAALFADTSDRPPDHEHDHGHEVTLAVKFVFRLARRTTEYLLILSRHGHDARATDGLARETPEKGEPRFIAADAAEFAHLFSDAWSTGARFAR